MLCDAVQESLMDFYSLAYIRFSHPPGDQNLITNGSADLFPNLEPSSNLYHVLFACHQVPSDSIIYHNDVSDVSDSFDF
jgi:hypothetical protein